MTIAPKAKELSYTDTRHDYLHTNQSWAEHQMHWQLQHWYCIILSGDPRFHILIMYGVAQRERYIDDCVVQADWRDDTA